MRPFLQFVRSRWRAHSAVLLALLLLLSGAAQAAHWHADGLDHSLGVRDEANCSLCLAGHAPAQQVRVCQAPVLVECAILLLAPARQLLAQQTIASPFIRPPPACLEHLS